MLWNRIQTRSDPKLLFGSGSNHSGSGQLWIRNEWRADFTIYQQNAQLKKTTFQKTFPKKLEAVKNFVYDHAPSTVFRIRIHRVRIWIQHFRLNIEPDPDEPDPDEPDPDPIQIESGSNPLSSRGATPGGRHRVSGRLAYNSSVCILQKLISRVIWTDVWPAWLRVRHWRSRSLAWRGRGAGSAQQSASSSRPGCKQK